MTSKEAVNLFKQYYWKVEDKEKALEILEKLVERDKPMKPIKDNRHVFTQYNCKVCNSRVDIPQLKEINYCPKCGQRIDWSDDK